MAAASLLRVLQVGALSAAQRGSGHSTAGTACVERLCKQLL